MRKLFLTTSFSAFALGALITPALSQSEPASLDLLIVTGSNIPTAEETGPSPIDIIQSRDISRASTQDVLSILQKTNPGFVGGGNLGKSNANIGSASTYGGSTISLRNLPTLVLIDGKRVADSSAASAGGFVFTDVSLIPTSFIERIEVLKDGASAIYGSDAIGGVVNVILKKDFNGVEAGARYGFAGEKNAQGDYITDYKLYGLVGYSSDRVRLVAGLEYTEQDPLFSRDRALSVRHYRSINYPGVAADVDFNLFQLNPTLSSPSQTNPTGPAAVGTNPADLTPGTYLPVSQDEVVNGFDLSQFTTQTLRSERTSVYGSLEFDLATNGAATLFGNFLYTSATSSSQLNAQPVNNFDTVVIPAGSPFNPFNVAVDASATTNFIANRYIANPRTFRQDTDFYRFVGGLKGRLFDDKVFYEGSYNFGLNKISFENGGLIIGQNINDAIAGGFDAAGNSVPGGSFSQVNGNLQPALDFFARPESVPSEALAGIFGIDRQELESSQSIFALKFSAFPLTLPAGDVGLAVGFEYREETLTASTIDPIFIGSTPIAALDVSRTVETAYGELAIPVFGGEFTFPALHRFDLTFAFRYDHYSDAGESTVPKIGFSYQPIPDLLFRGSYSKSFIAPTLFETKGPVSTGFTDEIFFDDVSQTQARQQTGANPNLEPSTAETYSLGAVLSPSFLKGLTISATWFSIEQEDVVGIVGAQTILSDVEDNGTSSPYAPNVRFGNFNGSQVTGPGQIAGNLNRIFVTDIQQNLGGVKVEGFDFDIRYRFEIAPDHAFTLGASAVYFTKYESQNLKTDPFTDIVGLNLDPTTGDNLPEYRITSFISYELGGLTWDLSFNYQPETLNATNIGLGDVTSSRGTLAAIEEYYTFDTQLSYEFGKNKNYASTTESNTGKDGKEIVTSLPGAKKTLLDGLRVSVGINNLFDQQAPFIAGATDNTDLSAFDTLGRYYYFEVSKKF